MVALFQIHAISVIMQTRSFRFLCRLSARVILSLKKKKKERLTVTFRTHTGYFVTLQRLC